MAPRPARPLRVAPAPGVLAAVIALAGCGQINFAERQQPDGPGPGGLTVGGARLTNVNSRTVLTASGGVPPYRFGLIAGQGRLDAATGELLTPAFAQALEVEVRDAAGASGRATVDVGGTYLYYVAGRDASDTTHDQVWRSEDGGATWQLHGTLPGTSYNGGLVVLDDAMVWMAGRPGGWRDEVWRSTDGVTWDLIGRLPSTRASFYPAVFAGALWVAGGYSDGVTRDQVWRSDDGGATWSGVGTLPLTIHGGPLVPHAGRLWYLGGLDEGGTGYRDDVWWSTDGASWTEVADVLPGACAYTSVHVDADGLMLAGGSDSPCGKDVFRSADAVAWRTWGTLEGAHSNGRLLRHRGELLYVAGGANLDGQPASDLVLVSPDGVAFVERGRLPAPRYGGGLVAFTPR
ncbi:MAG: exo-alpha-sialidase [Kofleriaceae bacterium]|nr:exo-alpha-sialidase [Kofleriaceae bacterium]